MSKTSVNTNGILTLRSTISPRESLTQTDPMRAHVHMHMHGHMLPCAECQRANFKAYPSAGPRRRTSIMPAAMRRSGCSAAGPARPGPSALPKSQDLYRRTTAARPPQVVATAGASTDTVCGRSPPHPMPSLARHRCADRHTRHGTQAPRCNGVAPMSRKAKREVVNTAYFRQSMLVTTPTRGRRRNYPTSIVRMGPIQSLTH